MFEWVQEAGKAFLSNGVQLILGTLLAVPLGFIKTRLQNISAIKAVLLVITAALIGMLIPMGPFGLLPLAIVLYAAGVQAFLIVPFLLSNSIFNLLVVFNDPWFVWSTGIRRILFAFISAVLAGVLIHLSEISDTKLISKRVTEDIRSDAFPEMVKSLGKKILMLFLFMTAGVILDAFFNKFALWKIFELFYMNPQTARIPQFFSSYDVDRPFFMLLLVIFKLFTNLTAMTAMVFTFKRKGIVLFIVYYGLLALLFALFVFI